MFRNISSTGEDVAAETVGEFDVESEMDNGQDALQPGSPRLTNGLQPLPLDDDWEPPLGILRSESDVDAIDNSLYPSTSRATTPNVCEI